MKQAPWREFATISVTAVLVVLLAVSAAAGDYGPGVLVRDYTPRNDAEAAILRFVRTVAEDGSERTSSSSCRYTPPTPSSAPGTSRIG